MTLKESNTIVAAQVAQTLGKEYMKNNGYLEGIPSDKLVDVGADITKDEKTFKSFLEGLAGRCARLEVEQRIYKGDMNSFMVKSYEWGMFIERTVFDLAEIVPDTRWNIFDSPAYDYCKDEHTYYDVKSSTLIFEELKPIRTQWSRPNDVAKNAFANDVEMGRFMSGLQQAVRNTIEKGIESYRHALAQCAIAYTTGSLASPNQAIHMLDITDAMGITTASDTAETFIKNADAMAVLAMTIGETRDNMQPLSTIYNDGTVPTHSPSGDSRLIILNKVDKALKFLVKANTYNKDELGFGDYERVTCWQAMKNSGGDFNLETVSSVYISQNATEDKLGIGLKTAAYQHKYCVGLLFDYMALGICPFRERTTTSYTASGDFWNTFHFIDLNLLLDKRYNMVSFWLDRASDWV